ncbi:fumarylacetoacetate hydrolase family protein [Vibrio sp. Isolate31]|uniref:fumarylacetoacetate hydrolase family protein n=1 Tax=unclassified Vibrio TaxID=2614977 RepID=UPI001EFECCF4|nr:MULTISPECIES: fumarylacetoacetate hydrolase family protein [unclassified Vibrio]MCG9554682.1 fumarylacetoacetate hydrolase family protein [Vibrio sp. Isolate32]MCG9600070.1 fumarylacetoacetate hydrolase family protein [Vibrio sp. Isolate31]
MNKIICVGRNYREHAKELNNPIPETPILFIKPTSCISSFEEIGATLCRYEEISYELELAIQIDQIESESSLSISGLGLGLDLTRRSLQSLLKSKGHPWERSKSFRGSCPITNFIDYKCPVSSFDQLDIEFTLAINDEIKQVGHINQMIFPVAQIVEDSHREFGIDSGDILMTGTPSGVGLLRKGDHVIATLLKDQNIIIKKELTI